VGAIIYMFVEPDYRKRNVGTMALEVISLIQAIQYCDFTILVVDDNGSGKLVEWYEKNGFSKAPKLQDMLGSPNAVNGVTMIAPTRQVLPPECRIQWW
jgi:ribosomal protein S18 acetylase RimI-like enzyme